MTSLQNAHTYASIQTNLLPCKVI